MKLFDFFALCSDPNDIADIYVFDKNGDRIAHTTYLSDEDYADIISSESDEDYVEAVKADYSALKAHENAIVIEINLIERYVICEEG